MVAKESTIKIPPRWGDDPLSEFFGLAFRNSLATFVGKRQPYQVLLRLHRNFLLLADGGLSNPTDFLGAALFQRSHSAYLAAARLVTGGQVPETFPLLRSCLEYAFYALHINRNIELGRTWLLRHQDADSLRAMKKSFKHVEVMATLEKCDPKLHGILSQLYEATIDFGGHPNERGVSGSMTMDESPGRKTFLTKYLHGDDVALLAGMKATAQVGLGSLSIFEKIFPERYAILGITAEITLLQSEL